MTKKLIIMGILMIPFLLLARMATAQNSQTREELNVTYKITNPELVTDLYKYEAALRKADLDSYRMQNESYIIKFESGLMVEVYSAEYLNSINRLSLEISSFPETFSPERFDSVFQLAENDYIVEIRPTASSKKISR